MCTRREGGTLHGKKALVSPMEPHRVYVNDQGVVMLRKKGLKNITKQ